MCGGAQGPFVVAAHSQLRHTSHDYIVYVPAPAFGYDDVYSQPAQSQVHRHAHGGREANSGIENSPFGPVQATHPLHLLQVNCTVVKEAWMQRLGGDGQVKAEVAAAATPVYDAVKDCVLHSTNLWYGASKWELQPRLLPVTEGPMLYRSHTSPHMCDCNSCGGIERVYCVYILNMSVVELLICSAAHNLFSCHFLMFVQGFCPLLARGKCAAVLQRPYPAAL